MNNTIEVSGCCRACLRNEATLISTTAIDIDNIKLSDKLYCCISEINWIKENLAISICTACLDKLRIAYDFKILCLQSDNTLQQCFFEKHPDRNVLVIESNNLVINNGLLTVNTPQQQQPQTSTDYLNTLLVAEDTFSVPDEPELISPCSTPDPLSLADFQPTPDTSQSRNAANSPPRPAAVGLQVAEIVEMPPSQKGAYTCVTCAKTYATQRLLSVHTRTHSREKPYECRYCSSEFSSIFLFKLHIRTHSGEKRFECAFCEKRFRLAAQLAVHRRRHLTEKPFMCSCCGRKYYRTRKLRVHMRTHAKLERPTTPYACTWCGTSFNMTAALRGHVDAHRDTIWFACIACDRKFPNSSVRRAHYQKSHKPPANERRPE